MNRLIFGAALACWAQEDVARKAAVDMLAGDLSVFDRLSPVVREKVTREKFEAAIKTVREKMGVCGLNEGPATRTAARVHVFSGRCGETLIGVRVILDEAGMVLGINMVPPALAPGNGEIDIGTLKLPATLTMPEGAGPFPVVVIVHGSGPQDADGTEGANKPYRDLAEGLKKRGVATLRYVKRFRVQTPPDPSAITVEEETIADALAAIRYARAQPRVDGKRAFVAGHSLGGYLAPRIAARDTALAGVIILAGPTRTLDEVIDAQMQYLGRPASDGDAVKKMMPAKYREDLAGYDPAKAARALDIPIFIAQGERDYQVTMVDFEGWRQGLEGRPRVKLKLYAAMNHQLIDGEGKPGPEEYRRAGHVSEALLDDVAAFAKQ